ncbi:MAG: 4-hydroxythreonine-4-phosphate dehydrogenase PdxA [Alphaproteobacteria bacterium]|nr:4-hydroxythreonine-4-phosphate dehydrogenase PdxA [Alphaproteobacteria bacterium]
MSALPLAVSMGDPAGIGLEIAVRAWCNRRSRLPPFYLVADSGAAMRAVARLGVKCPVGIIGHPSQVRGFFERALPVLPSPLATPETPGIPDSRNAPAIIKAIERAVAQAAEGDAAGVVTLPIAKAVLYEAGFRHAGHTEFIADLARDLPCGGPRGPVMMLATEGLRVALATIHAPFKDVAAHLTTEALAHTARVVLHALKQDFGIAAPRLVLAGLNPHAGEGGAIGREEVEIINPAAALLRAEGHDVSDARPADTLFHAEARTRYDAVVAMYHDQGLIPLKMLDFWGGVNITLGLPVVRTSPDHGTGFDIAGKGVARADSFIAALHAASAIAIRRAAAQ